MQLGTGRLGTGQLANRNDGPRRPPTNHRRTHRRQVCVVAAIMTLVAWSSSGCNRGARNAADQDAALASPLVADEIATQFAKDFENAVLIQDREAIHQFFDWDRILEKAIGEPAGIEPEVIASFREGAKLAYEERGLGAEMTRLANAGGKVRFLRLREREGRTRAIFRLTLPNGGGMNYCELVLAPIGQDLCKAIDMHSYLSGENMSLIIRRMFLTAVSDESQALLKSASDADPDVSNLQQVLKLTEASEVRDADQVLAIYEQLPAAVRQERSLMLMYLRAAAGHSEDKFDEAVEQFRKIHPNDPALDMLLVDRHIVKQRYEEALACVDRLDEAVGGDPYLEIQRAGVFVAKRDLDAARTSVNNAIKTDPSMEHAYWMGVTISLQTRQFEDTANLLDEIRDRFKTRYNDLSEITEYAEFVASPEYQVWRTRWLQRERDRKAGRTRKKQEESPATADPDADSGRSSTEPGNEEQIEADGESSKGEAASKPPAASDDPR